MALATGHGGGLDFWIGPALIHGALFGGQFGPRPVARCHQSTFCLRSHTAHMISVMATAISATPRTDPTVIVSFFCEEQSLLYAVLMAVGVEVPVSAVLDVELVGETSWAFERPATPSSGVASGNVNAGLPSIHANDEFVCVVLASPQQYCAPIEESARQTDRRTSLSR